MPPGPLELKFWIAITLGKDGSNMSLGVVSFGRWKEAENWVKQTADAQTPGSEGDKAIAAEEERACQG